MSSAPLAEDAGVPPRLGVLASGTGSILAALIADRLPIVVVATDRPCAAEKIATDAGVALERVERREFSPGFDREGYTAASDCDLIGQLFERWHLLPLLPT